ncbi:hypothetical protein MAC_02200 [Metarhizium acridum CQMa 102]|uniref:Uncharacterized protein n=1 Tax=Metarhizium acridum (strain CQMa 102) TaxID=655827 RepID=E9DX52_METAQ|nr:uncharacterized protein MAC_02200 [Metarhizium acridum CQMa 102]EFY91610.1 hypothetical protein MAC_02200 [Metarhizium acridum CQMa 102]
MIPPPRNPFGQPRSPGPHKRRHSPDSPQRPNDDDDVNCRATKKRRLRHPKFPPRQFWERLSQVPLTRNALRALEEQNTQARAAVQPQTRRRPQQHPRSIHQPASRVGDPDSPTSLKRIKAFARHGGPNLTHLRSYPAPSVLQSDMSSRLSSLGRRKRGSQSSSKTSTTKKTTSTKTTGPYDRAFQQHLIDHNILPHGYEYPDGRLPQVPNNINEIRQALAQPRASLSPSKFSDEDIRKFERVDAQAHKEREVTANVLPIIEGDVGDKKCIAGQLPFTNLEHVTDETLVPGNPDIYYGARPEQLHRTIRQELSNYIIPSTQHDLPIVPNYLFQAKGPDGRLSIAIRQASYNGALGARGLHHLQSYKLSEPELKYDNNAYTLTSVYHGGQLKMYTSHPIPPSVHGGKPGFVMTHINSWSMAGNCDAFRQGATAFRNGRDWAKHQRDTAINEANERASRDRAATSASLENGLGLSFESDPSVGTDISSQETNAISHVPVHESGSETETSADELSLEFEPQRKRTK